MIGASGVSNLQEQQISMRVAGGTVSLSIAVVRPFHECAWMDLLNAIGRN